MNDSISNDSMNDIDDNNIFIKFNNNKNHFLQFMPKLCSISNGNDDDIKSSQSTQPKGYGYGVKGQQFRTYDLTKISTLYIRAGDAIDSIGISNDDKVGGKGGGKKILDIDTKNNRILSISGEICKYTHNNNKTYVSQISFRTVKSLHSYGGGRPTRWQPQYTFSINSTEGIKQIKVYSDGKYVSGIEVM
eukprot:199210_1